VVSAETVAELEKRREEERKRRAPASVSPDLLSYTHLFELRRIIEQNWQRFAPALGAKKEFTAFLDRVEDYRNAPAHSRELLPHERMLLDGIAGEIRTRITAYRSSRAPDASYYPVIESVRDSFGNEPADLNPSAIWHIVRTGITLREGDTVEFECRGWDSQGRKLQWTCGSNASSVTAEGPQVRLTWTASKEDVGQLCPIDIKLNSDGEYHRHTYYDQKVTYHFKVDPPLNY
jgi:hypothetical protein